MKKEKKIIDERETKLVFLPWRFRRWFFKTYYNHGFVYVDKQNRPTYCSDVIRWLEEIQVITVSQKRADKLTFEYFHQKYPEYKKYVQLY